MHDLFPGQKTEYSAKNSLFKNVSIINIKQEHK